MDVQRTAVLGLLTTLLAGCVLLAVPLAAQEPVRPAIGEPAAFPPSASPVALDPVEATEAYLSTVSEEDRERSDAYFEGGYWLQLWGFLYGLGVAWLLLGTGLSTRMRDLGERLSRRKPIQTALYAIQYIVLTSLLAFPLTLYTGYFREHRYGLSNQTLGAWLGDQAKGMLVGAIFGALLLVALYGVIRRSPRRWWLWGSLVAVAFLIFAMLITPVFIMPLFNEYTPLEDPAVREPIVSMALANGVPATNVWVSDASRQSKRISANVSGFLGTERITLNDNLLNRTSLPEIEAVMAHEIGHYVLNHVYESLIYFGLLLVVAFAFLGWGFTWAHRRWGERWGIRGIGDVAGLPLLAAVLSVYFFVTTPLMNTIIRVNEAEADQFALNTSRQPDGFAQVALKLGEYRKLEPGPVEEWLFFDHPSGRSRIYAAMRWKAEHLDGAEGENR